MTHITKAINDCLLENDVVDFDQIFNDIFPTEDGDCLISRHDPSSAREIEYIDGSAVGNLQIGYYCRCESPSDCRTALTSIVDFIDGKTIEDVDDDITLNITVQTLPQFVSVDAKNNAVYTIELSVKYKRKSAI